MATDKKGFIIYCDLIHTVKKLPKEKQGDLFMHLLEYVNDLNPVTDDLLIELAFEPIKQQLKRDLKDWESKKLKRSEAGKLGGQARVNNLKQNQALLRDVKQNQANQAVIVNDNVNVNVNVNVIKEVLSVRKVNFSESLKPFLEKYSKDMLNNFFSYWTEHGEKDKKMRFEKERSFGLSQRLSTWYKNDYSPKSQTKIDNPYNLSPAQLESNRIAKLQIDEAIKRKDEENERIKSLENDTK